MTSMSIFPDPHAIRAVATRIASRAECERSRAADLDAAIASLSWHGAAADAFRDLVRLVPSGLRTSATDLDRAAAALRDLADNVESLRDDFARLGLDTAAARGDIIGALRDGTDPRVLLQHPGTLLHDGARLGVDGVALIGDGADLVGDAGKGIAHGVADGAKSLASLVGI